jgi:hypothetical protein
MAVEAKAEGGSAAASARTPPYVAFKTFVTLVDDLKTNGLPPRIDRSVLKRFSGGVGNQLLMGMKSLGLVTSENKPTTWLAGMVKGDSADFKVILKEALSYGYPFLRGIDLTTATPGMFADAFKTATGAKEEVLAKCRRFYLQAAVEAGVKIGPRLLEGGSSPARQSSGSVGSPKAAKKAAQPRQREKPRHVVYFDEAVPQSVQQQLIGKYPQFDPSWPEPIKTAWFEGFNKLMASTIIDQKAKGGQPD